MIIKHAFLCGILFTTAMSLQADEFLTAEQIKEILEAERKPQAELSTARRIYFCWSKPDHPKHVHAYEGFAKSFASQLNAVKNVQASTVEGYPTREQWESADLVVFNLTQSNLSPEQFAAMDSHLNQGGSVIVVH